MKTSIRNLSFALATLAGFAAASTGANAQSQCIQIGPRTDAGSSGVNVTNNCGRPVTVVALGDGMDYLNIRANSSFNWTTGTFDRWRACWGFSNTNC
jgi:hypothetical protein